MLIDVLLVVGDDGLGDGLTDGVDLGSVTTTSDANTDVDTGELVSADDQEGLVDLFGRKNRVRGLIQTLWYRSSIRLPHSARSMPFVCRNIILGYGIETWADGTRKWIGNLRVP